MRVQLWLSFVVGLALSGGIVAFQLASPDQHRRPSGEALGFQELRPSRVRGSFGNAAAHHQAAHRTLVARRTAGQEARRWLEALADSRANGRGLPRTVVTAPRNEAARGRIGMFVRWADDLPRTIWSAGVQRIEADGDVFVATGWVQVDLAQADSSVRRQRVPVQLDLVPTSVDAATETPAGFRLLDLRAAGTRERLRAYADPIVIDRPFVDLVAPAASRSEAAAWADHADRVFAALRSRHRAYAGTGFVTLWSVADRSRARGVIGTTVPADRSAAAADELHGAAWTAPDGDVALDLSRLHSIGEPARLGAIRHELAHVALRDLGGATPALVHEGVVLLEERRWSGDRDDPLHDVDPTRLLTAFSRAQSNLARLLVAHPDQPLDLDPGSVQADAAFATLAWLDDTRGLAAQAALLERLDAGMEPRNALRQVVRLDARGVEVAVARWVRARARAAAAAEAQERRRGARRDQQHATTTQEDP